ncbi:MAG: type I-E CRISPR-associated endonuclease Cas1e [Sphaerochaetaceae bacterium]|jgi:CRISPR-associated protein Cas1|nr:type I-E CRISPR-associated endonuclease Cas1e [Candidatus Cloacimonadota bacterium]
MANSRLLIKINKNNLPQVKDRYPFLYLERGRLEIDDSSVKWIDCDCNVVKIPIATISTLLLGPGTSITHEAVKVIAAANCTICWVGEDSMLFYAVGESPTSNTRNLRRQMKLSCNPSKSLEVARKLYAFRFPELDLSKSTLSELMGIEGKRVKQLYEAKAEKYGVGWAGRNYIPGKFMMSDFTNKVLTAANAALYGIISSAVYSMGYSPHIGFIHSGSPLPFVYDLADLYKESVCIDMAFYLTKELCGEYDRSRVIEEFRKRIIKEDVLSRIGKDIISALGEEE